MADPQSDRNAALSEARYLKSIFKIDEAIERLSAFVTPDRFDEEIMSELADCHFQNGDYESAAGTYFLLTSKFPRNILYKVTGGFYVKTDQPTTNYRPLPKTFP